MARRGSTKPRRPGGPVRFLDAGLRVTRLPGGTGLAVTGEVDLANHRSWQRTVSSLLVNGAPTRLDLSGLSFIDGRGAAALVSVAREMAPERTLTLYRPPLCLRRLLDLFWSEDHIKIVIVDEEAG